MINNINHRPLRSKTFSNLFTLAVAASVLAGGISAASAKSRRAWRDANASIAAGQKAPNQSIFGQGFLGQNFLGQSFSRNGSSNHSFSGMASYYGNEAGHRTASGQRFNQNAMTAAHRTLPFGTRVKVTHAGRSVVVTINDRGPFIRGRVLDLSTGAARAVGLTGRGVGRVVAEVQ